tara:strand:+ start:622 stop:816 length:195 start_codon:yes stop_codon:yes gene_type:complete
MKKSFYKPRIPNLDELKSLIEIIGYLYHDEQEHFEEQNGNNQDHIFNHLSTIKMYLIDIGIGRR